MHDPESSSVWDSEFTYVLPYRDRISLRSFGDQPREHAETGNRLRHEVTCRLDPSKTKVVARKIACSEVVLGSRIVADQD